MRCAQKILAILILICGVDATGQSFSLGDRQATTSAPSAERKSTSEPVAPGSTKFLRKIPVLRKAQQFAWSADFQYFVPNPGFDRRNRDIDLQAVRAAIAAEFHHGWELQLDTLVLRGRGTANFTLSPRFAPANALALGIGPLIRWNFPTFHRCRFFADAAGDLILADRPFPPQGSIYDFFLRSGVGTSFRLSNLNWLEAAFRVAHISNGQGINSGNPAWNGRGLSIGLRHTFGSP